MIEDWMLSQGEFVDPHEPLRSFDEILRLITAVEVSGNLKNYFDGANSGERSVFQILSREFVHQVSSVVNSVLRWGAGGPVLEVMSGDGLLTELLRPLVDREIVATDAKSGRYKIAYPKWVENMDAVEAMDRYDPSLVIICWEPHLSSAGMEIVDRKLPLIWIGERAMCGHPDLFERPHTKLDSPFALGRHDSVIQRDFRTDIYLFNCEYG